MTSVCSPVYFSHQFRFYLLLDAIKRGRDIMTDSQLAQDIEQKLNQLITTVETLPPNGRQQQRQCVGYLVYIWPFVSFCCHGDPAPVCDAVRPRLFLLYLLNASPSAHTDRGLIHPLAVVPRCHPTNQSLSRVVSSEGNG